jgi:polyhydroxyalkanoate synthesis regulator phasin
MMSPAPDPVRDVLVLTRERVQDVLDDAVRRGRMTRDDAADLLAELVRRGRRAAGLGPSFPIADYEDLTAVQVTERLDGLEPPDLRKVRDHERRNANRKTVLAAIERQLA